MTTVTFDNETIADAISKGNRIAPRLTSKTGHTAGLVLKVMPAGDKPGDEHSVLLRATDGQVFWDHWIDVVEVTGDPVEWRVLGDGLATLVQGLPFGSNKRITFSDEKMPGRRLDITRPGLRAWSALLVADSYEMWEPYDESFTEVVDMFAERVQLVSWAASRDETVIPWSGVMFDGKRVIASDAYRFASAPCEIPLTEPVTLPVTKLLPLLKNSGSVRLGVKDGRLLVCPDGYSQLSSAVFGRNYPDCSHILREDYEHSVPIDKVAFGAYVKRAAQMAAKQDSPGITLVIGDEQIEMRVQHPDGTEGYEQTFEVDGAVHEPIEFDVTPQIFMDVLNSGGGDDTVMHYDTAAEKRKPRLHFTGPYGYQAWMPHLQTKKAR